VTVKKKGIYSSSASWNRCRHEWLTSSVHVPSSHANWAVCLKARGMIWRTTGFATLGVRLAFSVAIQVWPTFAHVKAILYIDQWRHSVPDRVVWGQLALSNSPMGMWASGKYTLLYIVLCCLCCPNLWCVSVWFIRTWNLGLGACSKIWASQAEENQAKPPAWGALRSVLSHVAEVNVNHSTLGQKPGRTRPPQC
jgi:hypothetical protein